VAVVFVAINVFTFTIRPAASPHDGLSI